MVQTRLARGSNNPDRMKLRWRFLLASLIPLSPALSRWERESKTAALVLFFCTSSGERGRSPERRPYLDSRIGWAKPAPGRSVERSGPATAASNPGGLSNTQSAACPLIRQSTRDGMRFAFPPYGPTLLRRPRPRESVGCGERLPGRDTRQAANRIISRSHALEIGR